jgi:hypothetical protein
MPPIASYLIAVAMLISTAFNAVATYKLTAMHTKVQDIFCIERPFANN